MKNNERRTKNKNCLAWTKHGKSSPSRQCLFVMGSPESVPHSGTFGLINEHVRWLKVNSL